MEFEGFWVAVDLILLHALPFDASMWAGQENLIAGRTYAPTLYNLGNSLTDWAASVLAQVSGERLIVVGNSVGGSCALEMAMIAPERVAALVLVGAKAAHHPDPQLRQQAIDILHGSGVGSAWSRYWEPLFSESTAPEIRRNARQIALGVTADWIAKGVDAFHTRTARFDLLGELRCPVVCVTGEHDIAPGLSTMKAQAEAARNGRLVVVPDCGHYVPLEQPEKMNGIIRSVLDGLD